MSLDWNYEVHPTPADFSTALRRFRECQGHALAGHGSWIEFSTEGVEEVSRAYELAGLPRNDPSGVSWKSTGTDDKAEEAGGIALALVNLGLQDEDRLARIMYIHGHLVGTPKPATPDDQAVVFMHNHYWRASTGISWVHRGRVPRARARWAVFQKAFHELDLDRQWEEAKDYLQEGVGRASRRSAPRTEPVLEGTRVKGMGWDRYGAMNFFLTPPQAQVAASMFRTLRSKMLARVYSYTVSVGGTPSEIRAFAREYVKAGQVASFLGSRDQAFTDHEIQQLNDLGKSYRISQPVSLEFEDDAYSLDLSLARQDSAYHIGLHYSGRNIQPIIDRIQTEWGVQAKLLEVG